VTGKPLDASDLPPELIEALRAEAPNQTTAAQLEELTRIEQAVEQGDLDALWSIARDRQARARRARILLPVVLVLSGVAILIGIGIVLSGLLYR